MSELKIKTVNGKAKIYTPYNKDFVNGIHGIGGAKWNGGAWEVPESAIDAVRQIMVDVYGENDLESDIKLIVKVKARDDVWGHAESVSLFGKTLAHAWGRDSGARIGEDVNYTKHSARSGGSVRNWASIVPEDSEITLTNVSKRIFESQREAAEEDFEIVEVSEVSSKKDALQAEKEKLLARIAEIDEELKTA